MKVINFLIANTEVVLQKYLTINGNTQRNSGDTELD